jgi:hypothetical protein
MVKNTFREPQGGGRMKKTLIAVSMLAAVLATRANATASCAGDCSGDGEVAVDELIFAVDVALGRAALEGCKSVDGDGNGKVTIDEVVGAVDAALAGCASEEPRLIALSRDGRIASLELAEPWTVHASADLGATTASARCRDGLCLVAHPSPADSISIVRASDLSVVDTIRLERDADPRDVALVGSGTAIVSQYGRPELLELDLATRSIAPIDLSALADEDGRPEALRMAHCGRRVFVQLQRIDRDTGTPASIGAALAVIDLDRPEGDQVVDADPVTRGVQGIAIGGRPNFDMPVDCDAGLLYVAEPEPLMQGGGAYEQVDLDALVATPFLDPGAEVGGLEVLRPDLYWTITHTEFGPGASSHLTLTGGTSTDTYNTFASEHVDDLAFDPEKDLLFFPDNCVVTPANTSCDSGVHVFHGHTGEPASDGGIDVGFPPVEVAVSR